MSTPPQSNPEPQPSPIDFNNPEQVVRLALASLFASIAIARGDAPSTELVDKCVYCVDALLTATAAAKVVKP
jgi:hypothetical protein